ncbi:MAG: acetyltransferase [Actinomycetota bacterium]|nr:acetyltransferase [Actinomycetota bacterium]
MTRLVGIGAGGHAKVVLEILKLMGGYEIAAFVDPRKELWGRDVLEVPVRGDDTLLPSLYDQGIRHAFIGVGTTGDTRARRKLYQKVCGLGFEMVSAIHPQAIISPSAVIGQGVTIMAGTVINADAAIGDNVILNSGAIVEHDCVIGCHVHIATGACLAGTVFVGDGTHVGLGAMVRQSINIGQNVVVGAGALVLQDIPDNMVVAGVPARILKSAEN